MLTCTEIYTIIVAMITKEEAIAPFKTASALARALGLTRAAISLWPAGKPIPEINELKLKYEILPEVFNKDK